MKNKKWCRCVGGCPFLQSIEDDIQEQICKNRLCTNYNPKLNFFEAWEKAEDGGQLWHMCEGSNSIMTVRKEKTTHGMVWDCSGGPIAQWCLFEKEWTIIPKKKTVTTITMPADAENITVYHKDHTDSIEMTTLIKNIFKITYRT